MTRLAFLGMAAVLLALWALHRRERQTVWEPADVLAIVRERVEALPWQGRGHFAQDPPGYLREHVDRGAVLAILDQFEEPEPMFV